MPPLRLPAPTGCRRARAPRPLLDPAVMREQYRADGLAGVGPRRPTRWTSSPAGSQDAARGGLHEPNAMIVSTADADGRPQLPHGAAEAVRRARLRLLHQLRLPQGPRARREPVRLAALPLAPARPPGHRHRHRGPHRPRRDGRVLPHPPARLPARRLGERAVLGDRLARRNWTAHVRGAGRPLPGGRAGARRRRTGAASGSSRRRSSSGRAARTGCTTGCAMSVRTARQAGRLDASSGSAPDGRASRDPAAGRPVLGTQTTRGLWLRSQWRDGAGRTCRRARGSGDCLGFRPTDRPACTQVRRRAVSPQPPHASEYEIIFRITSFLVWLHTLGSRPGRHKRFPGTATISREHACVLRHVPVE